MVKKRGVKGTTQIDWAISLAVFLFYLAWFFLYVNPTILHTSSAEELVDPIKKKIFEETSWTVTQYPLIHYSPITEKDAVIMAPYPFSWQPGAFAVDQRYYAIDNDQLFFLGAAKQGTTTFNLTKSDEPYVQKAISSDIIIGKTFVSASQITAHFTDAFFDSLAYSNTTRVENIELSVNQRLVQNLDFTTNHSNSSIHYRRTLETELFNITSYFFHKHSTMYSFLTPNERANLSYYQLTFSGDLVDYDSYFGNNEHFGSINYADPSCISFNESFIDFYNPGSSGVGFILSNLSKIQFCYDTDELDRNIAQLSITMPFSRDNYFHIIFHEGNYNESLKYQEQPYTLIGAKTTKIGLSKKKIEEVFSEDYETLKNTFQVPPTRDFTLKITDHNQEPIYAYETLKPGNNINIFVKAYSCVLLDAQGNEESCSLTISTW